MPLRRTASTGPVRRSAYVAGFAVAALLAVAGCTAKSSSSDPSATAASGSAGDRTPSSGVSVPSASNSPVAPTGTSTGNGNAPPVPDPPTAAAGNAGAYALVSTGAGSVTTQVPTVTCAQNGSLTAPGITVSPGATSMTLTDVPPVGTITFTGSGDLTAAGGTFRGTADAAAIAFTWTC